jgi:uncharacterized protein (TIGR02246 family)
MTNDDLLDVRALVERYAWAVDDYDADGVVECFAPGARFVSADMVLEGHEAIRSFFTSALGDGAAPRSSTHSMTNISVVPRSADRCDVRTAALVYHADSDSGRIVVRGITYTDVCVRTAEGWRFEQREHRLRWAGEMTGATHAPESG